MPLLKYIMSKMKKSILTRATGARLITWMISLMKSPQKVGRRIKMELSEFLIYSILYNYITIN
jgi:hypothetical protein